MSEKLNRFTNLMKNIFELDKSDLDFGIYRIMNIRKAEVEKFLSEGLPQRVQDALAPFASNTEDIEKRIAEIDKICSDVGVDVATSKMAEEYATLKSQLAGGVDMSALETDVYSALYSFFNRYYDEGDFISKRRYKEGVYAIPYEGEEVKLYWANQDQYYIKSAENFKDYTFKDGDRTIHFRLVDATTEQNNNKESDDSKRTFMLWEETEEYPDIKTIEVNGNELIIRFVFDIPEDKKKKYAEENYQKISAAITSKYKQWFDLLRPIATSNPKKTKTLLEKHLEAYVAKNTFDYFIHKDLKGFLMRELDFYIKSEIIHLDDIDTVNEKRVGTYLAKVKAIKRVGKIVIDFLAQIENFQKKLWLKKKFVVNTNWCITLDRVDESFYDEILHNEAQILEWQELYGVDKSEIDQYSSAREFLCKNKNLIIDTKYFSTDFKGRLIATFDNLDKQTNGLLIHGDNFHALNLLCERFGGKVKMTYIDPPYNKGDDGFLFKDTLKHSSWMTMIMDRLRFSQYMSSDDGVIYASVDAVERARLEEALNMTYSSENRVEELIWAQNTTKNQSPTFSTNHEYVEVYAKNLSTIKQIPDMFREKKPGLEEVNALLDELNPQFPTIKEAEKKLKELYERRKNELKEKGIKPADDIWKSLYNYNHIEYRDAEGCYINEADAKKVNAMLWVWREVDTSMPQVKGDSQKSEFRDPNNPEYRFYEPIHPHTGKLCRAPKTGWRWPMNPYKNQSTCFNELVLKNRIVWGSDERKIPQQKSFLREVETNVSKSVITDYADGEKELANLFGRSRSFSNPKPSSLIQRFVNQMSDKNGLYMDFFAGSGTLAQAVINANYDDSGMRQYILVEMGNYFDNITLARVKKLIYSIDWKDGKPKSQHGNGKQIIKYIELEGYEDSLSNVQLSDEKHELKSLFGDSYLINYMLDIEAEGSILNLDLFKTPFNYKMKINENNETKDKIVDLVETFNYLLGVTVVRQSVIAYFKAERDDKGSYDGAVRLVKDIDGEYGFKQIEGTLPDGRRVLIIWRTVTDDLIASNAALDAYFAKHRINPADREFDILYVNGDNNLENMKADDECWKVNMIEIEFKNRMFEEA